MEQLKGVQILLPESQGQILALTVLYDLTVLYAQGQILALTVLYILDCLICGTFFSAR